MQTNSTTFHFLYDSCHCTKLVLLMVSNKVCHLRRAVDTVLPVHFIVRGFRLFLAIIHLLPEVFIAIAMNT